MSRLLYTGSVKKIFEDVPATETSFGKGYMLFDNNGFSVFDYGTMPWEIKGKAQCLVDETGVFSEVLQKAGIPTHFTGHLYWFRDVDGIHVDLEDDISTHFTDRKGRAFYIMLARMLGYEDIIPGESIIYRIPIECVFSHVVTPVSSLHGRLRSGKENPGDFGLERPPGKDEVIQLLSVKTSYSTKIESTDIYKGLPAMSLPAGLVANEPQNLDDLTRYCAGLFIADAERKGFILADGKFEFIMGPGRNLYVADTGYTWDENRILIDTGNGRYVDISKQFPRNVYTITGWKKALKDAQKAHPEDESKWPGPPHFEEEEEFRELCGRACEQARQCITAGADDGTVALARDLRDFQERLKDRYHRDELGEDI